MRHDPPPKEPPSAEIAPKALLLPAPGVPQEHRPLRRDQRRPGDRPAARARRGPRREEGGRRGPGDPPRPRGAGGHARTSPRSLYTASDPRTSYEDITTYNNFYEFGPDKADPAENARHAAPAPWTVAVEGEVKKPQGSTSTSCSSWFPLEERVYRMRCVEAWSMVIPWLGFPLGELIKRVEPTSRAKYVAFTTLLDPEQMPGQQRARAGLAVRRGAAHRRGDAPAGAPGGRASTARRCRTRTARRSGWWCRGSTASRAIKSIVRIRFTESAAADHLEPGGAATSTASTPT